MRAIGYEHAGPITRTDALLALDVPEPKVGGRDLLVEIRAISVNPVDVKIRASQSPPDGEHRVLGWDASGIVKAVGPNVSYFGVGDEVFYAGEVKRPGVNSELHVVDERLVGRKPNCFTWAEAAAMPLTGVTAWEVLFDRLDVGRQVDGAARAILVVGGAGGVGSIAIQLARQLTDLTVIATASREETRSWAKGLGAHHVIDHSNALADQVAGLGLGAPAFAFSTTHSAKHRLELANLLAPEGRLAVIDDPDEFDIVPFKNKSISVHWELMFTRSIFPALNMGRQGWILGQMADLVEAGHLRTTLSERLSPINVANLKRAHALVESGTMRGKVVLEGWD